MALRKRRPGLVYPVYEDWHYVGDTGEPDWYDPGGGDAWENANATVYNLGFRIRETGILDIQGSIVATSDPPDSSFVFTLPAGYRPASRFEDSATGTTTGSHKVPILIAVYSTGLVEIATADVDPYPVPGGTDALANVSIALQVFLTPTSAP